MFHFIFIGLISHVTRGNKMRAVFFQPRHPKHRAFFLVYSKGARYLTGLPQADLKGHSDDVAAYLLDFPLEIVGIEKNLVKTQEFLDHIPPLTRISSGEQIRAAVVQRKPGAGFAGFVDYYGKVSVHGFFCNRAEFLPVVNWPGTHCIARIVTVDAKPTTHTVILRRKDKTAQITIPADAIVAFLNLPTNRHTGPHFVTHYSLFANTSSGPLGLPTERERCPEGDCRHHPFFLTVECSNTQVP